MSRGPEEPLSPEAREFYGKLLECLRRPEAGDGDWQLLECTPAWDGNWTWDCFISSALRGRDGRLLV